MRLEYCPLLAPSSIAVAVTHGRQRQGRWSNAAPPADSAHDAAKTGSRNTLGWNRASPAGVVCGCDRLGFVCSSHAPSRIAHRHNCPMLPSRSIGRSMHALDGTSLTSRRHVDDKCVAAGTCGDSLPCQTSAGRRSSKIAPPSGALAAVTVPPWVSTIARTIERPRPLPDGTAVLARAASTCKRSKTRGRCSGDPRPSPGR